MDQPRQLLKQWQQSTHLASQQSHQNIESKRQQGSGHRIRRYQVEWTAFFEWIYQPESVAHCWRIR